MATDTAKRQMGTRNSLPDFISEATAPNTKLAYEKDVARFRAWGGAIPCNADIVCKYLQAFALLNKPNTLERWVAAISRAHKDIGFESPCNAHEVRDTLTGIRKHRAKKRLPNNPRQVNAAVREELFAMLDHTPANLVGMRNRAILLIGFSGALRRSEVSRLTIESVQFDPRGLIVDLGATKADQAAENATIAIPRASHAHCPVKALKAWLKAAAITGGPIFRPILKSGSVAPKGLSGHSIAEIVKTCAAAAGLDRTMYSGHSLRAGLVTTAIKERKPTHKIRAQTRHKSDSSLQPYNRTPELFEDNAADIL
jgi:integrase